jgi:ABC-2 type transport system ATP-binding protein
MMHDAAEALVEFHDPEMRFGAVEALGGVSLTIRARTVYALLGGNGAGKTTLINVLATLLRPDGGHATVRGDDVVRHPRAVRAGSVWPVSSPLSTPT